MSERVKFFTFREIPGALTTEHTEYADGRRQIGE